ncbi:agamous-like mads-box protein agl80-like [Trifolium pratense]|uniref:Agamous-like mads-box protein agl80-like n=1 Tax=Trifolium pratense TaxID=57577 RepID=A0A2K3MVF0_TRIPR|nr:agamous-like mads-box protein agl80-like [Trifolium pratense]PNX94726.1 agamous-like mads-box protein agl80-like [Trifolium pratense]
MARNKVKLAFISDESKRRASYIKRKRSLIKKVTELTTLCDVPACAVISSPFDSHIDVWPNLEGAKNVIERYQNSTVINESKNVSHQRFIMQRTAKARDQLKKLKHGNREKELNLLMFEYLQNNNISYDLTPEEAKDLDKVVGKMLKEVDNKINTLD